MYDSIYMVLLRGDEEDEDDVWLLVDLVFSSSDIFCEIGEDDDSEHNNLTP